MCVGAVLILSVGSSSQAGVGMNPQPDTGIVGRVSYWFAFSSFRREPVYRWPGKEGRTDEWAALLCTAQAGIRT